VKFCTLGDVIVGGRIISHEMITPHKTTLSLDNNDKTRIKNYLILLFTFLFRFERIKRVQEVLYAFVHKLCHIKSVEEMRMN